MAERILSATINGKRRQVLMMMNDFEHNNLDAGWDLMVSTERYWDTFWEGATLADFDAAITDIKLKKPRT